jgi:hypothetical protein
LYNIPKIEQHDWMKKESGYETDLVNSFDCSHPPAGSMRAGGRTPPGTRGNGYTRFNQYLDPPYRNN